MAVDLSTRPEPSAVADYFRPYVDRVREGSILETLDDQGDLLASFIESLDADQLAHAYAPGKWTLAQVLQHVIDGERVFAYRALCFARGEPSPQPGFDHDGWVADLAGQAPTAEGLAAAWRAARANTLALLADLSDAAWERSGEANGQRLSVRAVAWLMAGHADHHAAVLGERYLTEGSGED